MIEADGARLGLRRRMEHYHRFPGWRRGGVELRHLQDELMRVLHPLERISSALARIIRPLDNQRRSWLTVLAGIMEPDIIRERGALDLPEGELFEVSPEGKVRIALAATDQPVADAATYVDADGNVLVDDLPGPTRDLWQRAENWLRMYHDIYFGTERMIGLRDIAEELGIEVGYIPGYVSNFGATALPEDVVDFVKRQLAPYAKHPEIKEFIEALSPGPEQTLPADVIQQAIDTLELPDEVKVLLAELEGKTLDEVREALAAQVPAATH